MSKISIIVPVYNVEKYLPKCLDSLINQTYSDIEIICVNDGSTDNSMKVLIEYARVDSRIKIISQQNKGLAGARNTGIDNAMGDYILFVDSDDWIELDACEKLNHILEQYKDIDYIKYDINETSDEKCIVKQKKINNTLVDLNEKNVDKISSKINNLFAWDKLYSKRFIDKYNFRFSEIVKKHEDAIWCMLLYLNEPTFVITNLKIYNYRQAREGSLMNTHPEKVLDMADIWLNELENFRQKYQINKDNKIYQYCFDYVLKLILIERTKLPYGEYSSQYFMLLNRIQKEYSLKRKIKWYYHLVFYIYIEKFKLLKAYLFLRNIYRFIYRKLK